MTAQLKDWRFSIDGREVSPGPLTGRESANSLGRRAERDDRARSFSQERHQIDVRGFVHVGTATSSARIYGSLKTSKTEQQVIHSLNWYVLSERIEKLPVASRRSTASASAVQPILACHYSIATAGSLTRSIVGIFPGFTCTVPDDPSGWPDGAAVRPCWTRVGCQRHRLHRPACRGPRPSPLGGSQSGSAEAATRPRQVPPKCTQPNGRCGFARRLSSARRPPRRLAKTIYPAPFRLIDLFGTAPGPATPMP